jgi:hypothetical protein
VVRDPRRALSGFLVFLLLVSSAGLTACPREIRTVGRVEYDERKLAFVKLKIMVPLAILLIVLLLYLNFRSLLQTFSGSADPFSMWRERQDWRHCVMRISIGR